MSDELRPEWLPWITENGEVKLVKVWSGLAELSAAGVFDVPLSAEARDWLNSLPNASGTFEGELLDESD